jgi:hypothetical protein
MTTLSQFRRQIRKSGVYLTLYPGNSSSNWDGTWWVAQWSDGEVDHLTVSAYRKFDGLAYCRRKATERAYELRARVSGVTLEDR